MSEDLTTGQLQLVVVDPKSGSMTPVGNPISSEAQAQAVATLDQDNGTYYILGFDGKAPNIMGVDIKTGTVKSEAEIPAFQSSMFVGVGEGIDWEPDSGAVVAAGQDKTQSWSIGLINPKTGEFDLKAFINNTDKSYDPVLAAPSVYTVDQQDFVMELGIVNPPDIKFVAANLPTGKFHLLDWCGDTETVDYDPVTKSIFGIGLTIDPDQPGGAMRTLVQVNSDASGCSVVGNITDYWIIEGGVSAIDVTNRILYFLAFPCLNKTDPGCQGIGNLDLVGVDLKTAKVVSAASGMCSMGVCPWSLEFSNGKSIKPEASSRVTKPASSAPASPRTARPKGLKSTVKRGRKL